MTREQSFFLRTLADHLHGAATNPPEGLDWTQIATYAKNHEVEGIVYYQCKDFLTTHEELTAVAKKLSKAYAAATFFYLNRTAMYGEIIKRLEAAQIPYFAVKGLEVAKYYPIPGLRTMGDCDLVTHTEDRPRAEEIMLQMGFKRINRTKEHEWLLIKNDIAFEVHDHLLYEISLNKPQHIAYFSKCWDHVKGNELDLRFHMLFLVFHLRMHMLWYGVGFRQFIDIALMMQQIKEERDRNWIEEEFEALGLLEFARNCLGFCDSWFGLKQTVQVNIPDAKFYELATEKIFGNGVFGFNDEENKLNWTFDEEREYHKATFFSVLALKLQGIFPRYRDMVWVDHYAFLRGRPYLLPIAWIYRLFRAIKKGRIRDAKRITQSSVKIAEGYEKRDTLLRKWGL